MIKSKNNAKLFTVCLVVSFLAMTYFFLMGLVDGLTAFEFISSSLVPMAGFVVVLSTSLGLFPDDSCNAENLQLTKTKKKSYAVRLGLWLLGVCFGLALMVVLMWLLFAGVSYGGGRLW